MVIFPSNSLVFRFASKTFCRFPMSIIRDTFPDIWSSVSHHPNKKIFTIFLFRWQFQLSHHFRHTVLVESLLQTHCTRWFLKTDCSSWVTTSDCTTCVFTSKCTSWVTTVDTLYQLILVLQTYSASWAIPSWVTTVDTLYQFIRLLQTFCQLSHYQLSHYCWHTTSWFFTADLLYQLSLNCRQTVSVTSLTCIFL